MSEDNVTNGELARLLRRLEVKIDQALNDHELRLRRVERLIYIATGLSLAGGITGVGSMVGGLV